MDERAEFEAWAKPIGYKVKWSEADAMFIAGYENAPAHHAYEGWQAATQRQQERIAELEAQVQALTREAVVLAEKAETHDAINRACAELPEGYDLHIELEKNAGTVRLYLLDSDADVTDFGSDLGFVGEINAAIDASIAAGKGEA